ncbi:alpha-1,3-mannosyl-glycoprotein 4-beta-N-acetylglucosaminyltransferase C isoform X6 [Symphalangus syndactylus]|uniref:alpha-1,3-mannosyl-glycoprotein 4-beta-N-acetylglucosaminyltransferase C isoform X6 n=1 Tax=Symphalangus syndactylus TaxID=9590 RepID=UPI002442FAC2|nr:alpha-1,3-mannosyl-glycoprotein 4-beta-N-acetylglucosaminyltransferase C isoform X6 [Symphalangus syndactylus]
MRDTVLAGVIDLGYQEEISLLLHNRGYQRFLYSTDYDSVFLKTIIWSTGSGVEITNGSSINQQEVKTKASKKRMLKFHQMKHIFEILDKMRCLRKRSTVSFLGIFVIFLLFMNLYIEDSYVLEGDKQLIRETSTHQLNSERYVHTFKDLSNFSGAINVTYRYLAATPLQRKRYLTIGLSSVKRKKGNYLLETIKSIFEQSSYEELKEISVVVHLADFNSSWRDAMVQDITQKFAHHIIAGRLMVIHAPEEYYPILDGLKRNYNDPEDRVKFRSKQNVDYAFLLNFCANTSDYYVMLEDDVRCSKNFLTAIKKVIASLEGTYWHMGYYSSYKGTENKLKDDDFEEESFDIPDNPPASLYTNMNVFENYEASKAYSSVDEYFWGKPPSTGDVFVIVFENPITVKKIKVNTGTEDRQNDILHHGALDVGENILPSKQRRQCSTYLRLGEFKNGNFEMSGVNQKIPFDIHCMRIYVTKTQKEWLIIRSISIWTS